MRASSSGILYPRISADGRLASWEECRNLVSHEDSSISPLVSSISPLIVVLYCARSGAIPNTSLRQSSSRFSAMVMHDDNGFALVWIFQ